MTAEKVSGGVYVHTFGCPKNTADSENIAYLVKRAGYALTDDAETADVIIINTCCFIEDAKRESVEGILSAILIKAERPEVRLIVCGCLAQRYAAELETEMPEVDYFVGTNRLEDLPEILGGGVRQRAVLGDINAYPAECGRERTETGSASAYIKISEGCNKHCTYCIIPKIKGAHRSRKMEDICAEAEKLAAGGVTELILVAQDTGEYGSDLYGRHMLTELIKKLETIDGLHWLRLLYVYPETIDDELIECMAHSKKLLHYIDIPFQHINDKILRAMNRHTDGAAIKALIARLRERIPDIAIRSSFICGFPGETDEQTEELRRFLAEERLTRAGVFTYSQEENTPAAAMPGQISQEEKEKRFDILMEAQERVSEVILQTYIGKTLEVLIEETAEENIYAGRSYLDAPDIDGCVYVESAEMLKLGGYYRVEITDSFEYDLYGRIVE